MALLDVFKRKSPVERLSKELNEPYAQPDARRVAMQKLIELNTAEAHAALLKRFTFSASGHIADESEKRDLVEELVQLGEGVLPSLEHFIRTEKLINFPIEALRKLRGDDDARAFLLATLKAKEPLDHRTTEAKATLIAALGELVTPDQAPDLVPYLKDHHDDVQFRTLEVLDQLAVAETAPALIEICTADASHSPRIQRRAAQVLVERGWPVAEAYPRFHPELRSEFVLSKSGALTKKGAPG